jgi:hypothetical protein
VNFLLTAQEGGSAQSFFEFEEIEPLR